MWAHHSSSRAHLLYVTDVISWHMIIYHLICHNFYTVREYSGFQAHMAKSMTTLGSKNHLYSAKTCRRGRLFGFMDCAVAICYLVTLLLTVLKRNSFEHFERQEIWKIRYRDVLAWTYERSRKQFLMFDY